ncbi:MAG: hypothetical protein ACRDMX_16400 [Solirubrobacteraceae bacterium]
MKKFGTPTAAGPGIASEKVGLLADGTPLPDGSLCAGRAVRERRCARAWIAWPACGCDERGSDLPGPLGAGAAAGADEDELLVVVVVPVDDVGEPVVELLVVVGLVVATVGVPVVPVVPVVGVLGVVEPVAAVVPDVVEVVLVVDELLVEVEVSDPKAEVELETGGGTVGRGVPEPVEPPPSAHAGSAATANAASIDPASADARATLRRRLTAALLRGPSSASALQCGQPNAGGRDATH